MIAEAGIPEGEELNAAAFKPEEWMGEVIPRSVWEAMGLDVAPFCVQAEAPMHLVHFYFSQLTLNAVFVTDTSSTPPVSTVTSIVMVRPSLQFE